MYMYSCLVTVCTPFHIRLGLGDSLHHLSCPPLRSRLISFKARLSAEGYGNPQHTAPAMATVLSYAMSLDTQFSGLRRLPSRSTAVNQTKAQPGRKLAVVKVEAANAYRPGSTIGPIQDQFLPFL